MAKAKKRRSRVRKQSGDKASSIAASLLRYAESGTMYWMLDERDDFMEGWRNVTQMVKTVCASVLSQDETRGPRR